MNDNVFDAADPQLQGPASVTGAMFYGPPRSKIGRFRNFVRRLFRRDERDEIYGFFDKNAVTGASVTVSWDSSGILSVDDD